MTQYYCYTRSEYRVESSFKWIFLLCLYQPVLLTCFLLGRSAPVYRLFLLFTSINRFSSGQFALVRRRNCFRSYSRQFRFSPSIVYALQLARSASVCRLFMLFSSINRFSSRQFRSSSSITSGLQLMDLGGVRREMARKNCERANTVKTVNGYVF